MGTRIARGAPKAESWAIFIDIFAPASPLFDTHLQAVELLRDPSHVRDYSIAEWTTARSKAGIAIESLRTWRLRVDFDAWTMRMRTPREHAVAIRALQAAASVETRAHFAIEPEGSFRIDALMIDAKAGKG